MNLEDLARRLQVLEDIEAIKKLNNKESVLCESLMETVTS